MNVNPAVDWSTVLQSNSLFGLLQSLTDGPDDPDGPDGWRR